MTKSILMGVVGSQAYGLATEDSDVDKLGIYLAPSNEFLGLNPPTDKNSTIHTAKPDITMHEAGKFCRLALKMNPSVYELLWLDRYEVKSADAAWLLEIRKAFQSRKAVRDAYFGYAVHQLKKLENNGRTPRGEKNARHLLRLLVQGHELYTTGELTVNLGHVADEVREFGRQAVETPSTAHQVVDRYEKAFDNAASPLPEKPDTDTINNWLLTVRRSML